MRNDAVETNKLRFNFRAYWNFSDSKYGGPGTGQFRFHFSLLPLSAVFSHGQGLCVLLLSSVSGIHENPEVGSLF